MGGKGRARPSPHRGLRRSRKSLSGLAEGFILAGGKSSRMGREKALLPWGHETLIEHLIQVIRPAVQKVSVLASPETIPLQLGVQVQPDLRPQCGPLGGIYTGLAVSSAHRNLFLACDMPLMRTDFLIWLLELSCDSDVTVPNTRSGPEPLCAVYAKSCLNPVGEMLGRGFCKVDGLYDVKHLRVKYLSLEGTVFDDSIFRNINTPEEYREIVSKITKYGCV